MAVRAAAGTGYLTKAPSGFSAAPWTVIGWQRAQLSGGIGHNAISLVNAGITTYNYLYVGTDGAVSAGTDGGDGATSTGEIPTDTWVPVVLTRTGSTVTARRVDSRASATYGSAGTNTVASIWALGSQPDESRRDMRGLKVWSALLSADEIAAEIQQFEPVRTANLVHYAPLAEHTDLADAIAGGSWTNNGASLSTVDDPANVAEEWEGPKVAASNTTNATSSSGGLSINLPSGIVAGNLLLAFAANDTSVSWSATGTWAQIDNGANGTAVQGACWARIATADANDNLTITGEANDIAVVTLRVVDHGVSNVSSDIVLGSAATGSDGAPDAPNCNPGTSGKWLWLSYFAADDDDDTTYWWPVEGAPVAQVKSAASTSSCMVGVAYRWLEASSYNPTAFAMSASEEWRAQTLAIPAAASEVTAALTGSSSTTSSGTVGVAHEQAVTGSAVTASAGTLSPLAEYSAALTGAEVTASAGTLAPVQTAALTGSAATVSAGSVASTRTVAISGSEVETAAGTLTPGSETIAELTGAEVTASAGSLAVERSADLAGSESTTAAGALTAGSTRALEGAETTAAAGTIVAGPSAALVGSEVESASGTLSSGATVALVGSEVESATGTLAPVTDDSVSLTGSAATASAGTVAPDVSVELTGDEVATAAGTLGVSIGENVSVELTGAAATCSAGSLGAGAAIGVSGAASTTAAGTVGGYVDLGLTGIGVGCLDGELSAGRGLVFGRLIERDRRRQVVSRTNDLTIVRTNDRAVDRSNTQSRARGT